MYTLLFMLTFMQVDTLTEEGLRLLSVFEVQAKAYPQEEVAFGDIAFLRYTYKNVSGRPGMMDYTRVRLFDFALYQDIDGHESRVWKYGKAGFFERGLFGNTTLYSILLQPDETFTVYEAVLMPSPARGNPAFRFGRQPHPFWDFPENSRKEFSIDPNADGQSWPARFHYIPARIPMVIVSHPAQEMQFLKNWFDRALGDARYSFVNSSVYASVDPVLAGIFENVTLEGKQEILDNLSSGTFRDLIQLHTSLGLGVVEWGHYHRDYPRPAMAGIMWEVGRIEAGEPERLFIDSYQSPDAEFWAWFDKLPEIQRHFFAIAVVRAYCSRILAPNPEWVTLPDHPFAAHPSRIEEMERVLRRAAAEYANRRAQYDRVIADWLPRLPQEPGEGREIIRLLQRLQKPEEPSP